MPGLRAAALVVLALATTAFVARLHLGAAAMATHVADADDLQAVMLGKKTYMERCASCHGRALQGQPLWQLTERDAPRRRAPALDHTGEAWQHPDEDLFLATKYGGSAGAAPSAGSDMPGFKDVLDDREILAVIAFMKARWPIGLRVLQATHNAGSAGMPGAASKTDWRLPPDCFHGEFRG